MLLGTRPQCLQVPNPELTFDGTGNLDNDGVIRRQGCADFTVQPCQNLAVQPFSRVVANGDEPILLFVGKRSSIGSNIPDPAFLNILDVESLALDGLNRRRNYSH